jgi:hypothetical protein
MAWQLFSYTHMPDGRRELPTGVQPSVFFETRK